jgi:hypothetical protein
LKWQGLPLLTAVVKGKYYSESQRASVIKIFETLPGLYQEKLRVINGTERSIAVTIRSKRKLSKCKKRVGRQVSREFEREVGGELILTE